MSWSYGDGTQGYLYSSSYPVNPPVSFAGVTASGPSPCSSIWNADYQGISNVCLFTSASNYTFTLPSQTNSVRVFEKSSACYHGLLPFKQGNYYGVIDPEDITASGTLTYRYWYDASGGSNFSSVCAPAPPPPPSSTATSTPTQTSACASTIINGYSVPGKNSGESVTVTISSAVPNGTRYASTTFTCTNGSFTAGSETANITCNTGYASVGTQCVATIPQVQGVTATVSGTSVTLSWQDAAAPYSLSGAPNNTFGSYNVYRGSSADFTPSPIPSNPTNLIVQGSVLSYTGSNLAAGTYYYKVALQDVNGVVGPASAAVSVVIPASPKPAVVTFSGVDGTWCYKSDYYPEAPWSYRLTRKGYCQDHTGVYSTDYCSGSTIKEYSCGLYQIANGNTTRCVLDGFGCSGTFGNACSDGACITATTTSSAESVSPNFASVFEALARTLEALRQQLRALR